MAKEKTKYFRQPLIIQLYGYIMFVPFFFAVHPLLKDYSKLDLILFAAALTFVVIILLLNHIIAKISITGDRIVIYNRFKNKPDSRKLSEITGYNKISNNRVVVNFTDENYDIKLNMYDMKRFIKLLEEII